MGFFSLKNLAAIVAAAIPVQSAGTKSYNGLAITPAMGWDNWNAFACKVTEELMLTTAQRILDFGLRDLGQFHAKS